MSVVVVKLGVGNTASVMFALERIGAKARLTADPREIAEAGRVIFPGVGAAAFAMEKIGSGGLKCALTEFPRPLLGICLGHQLLFERSEEGGVEALGLLEGEVKRLAASIDRPVPHMGWSRLAILEASPLLEGVKSGDYCFFVHSYAAPVNEWTIASADYGGAFAAVVNRGNVYGCQFHPERSGETGQRILSNFLALPC
ncbi:MAG: imidazole glycerol phosphate synthase subunit HisH [Pseudomonadota bacterium]